MNILYATDNKFVPVMGVSITSLFESNKDLDELNVYIFGLNIDTDNRQKLCNLSEQYGRRIEIIDAEKIEKHLSNSGAARHKDSLITWYRCFVSELLPENVDRVLYIDSDCVVVGSLKELEFFEFQDGKAVAAVDVSSPADINSLWHQKTFCKAERIALNKAIDEMSDVVEWANNMKKCIGNRKADPYVCVGVTLYDMARWREYGCQEMILAAINEYGKDIFVDQDTMNYALRDYIQELSQKVQRCTYGLSQHLGDDLNATARQLYDKWLPNTMIIHLVGVFGRPWHEDCDEVFTNEWREYKSISPWKDEPLNTIAGEQRISKSMSGVIGVFQRITPRWLRKIRRQMLWRQNCKRCTRNMPCGVKR